MKLSIKSNWHNKLLQSHFYKLSNKTETYDIRKYKYLKEAYFSKMLSFSRCNIPNLFHKRKFQVIINIVKDQKPFTL
jgi:hypothetical protein